MQTANTSTRPQPWNKGKYIGPKPPLQRRHVWAIRTQLNLARRTRDLALFNLAIDSKLRGCDVVSLRVEDVAPHGHTIERATVRQKKTGRPVKGRLIGEAKGCITIRANRTRRRVTAVIVRWKAPRPVRPWCMAWIRFGAFRPPCQPEFPCRDSPM